MRHEQPIAIWQIHISRRELSNAISIDPEIPGDDPHTPPPARSPAPGDVAAALTAQALAESIGDGELAEQRIKMADDLEASARTRSSAADLPPRKAISCALTLGMRIDSAIFTTVLVLRRARSVLRRAVSVP